MTNNNALYQRACLTNPGGVNSPVRAFKSVGGTPRFIARAKGPHIWDIEGNCYIDYLGSWGPAIVGHAHPEVVEAVQQAAANGLSFGAPTEAEVLLAEKITQLLPAMEQVRLVSSGTEATMSAIRLARGATGRKKIIKFDGCYHGHSDSLLVKAGSGLLTFAKDGTNTAHAPSSAGVPEEFVAHTLVLPYNDLAAVQQAFEAQGEEIACIIVEPIAGNMNLIKPKEGFLEGLRQVCDEYGALLIFDEVMTGFRAHPKGVQGLYNITPDLTTLGKIIGGGMPVGAFGGCREVMQHIAPLGSVYQAGTLSGNPVSVAAGLKTLEIISRPGFYEQLEGQMRKLIEGLREIGQAAGVPFNADYVGGMFGLYFNETIPHDFTSVSRSNVEQFKIFFHQMLEAGVHLAPSAFEAGFISAAHDDDIIAQTLDAARSSFAHLA